MQTDTTATKTAINAKKKKIQAAAPEMLRVLEFIYKHNYMDLPVETMRMVRLEIEQTKGDK